MGAAPTEKEDDPAVLHTLAHQIVKDDAVLVIAELVAHSKAESIKRPAAEVLLSMANTPEARGKIVQQGGFKALISLTIDGDEGTKKAAAWALAKVGISINPALYPRRTGSGPEEIVKPLIRLVDEMAHELTTFECCMCLCNLATVEELRDRIVREKGWRVLEMALTSDNELVQRAAVECMSNLVTNDEIAEKFVSPTSTATKVFVGFCGSHDVKTQLAASGGVATLSAVPEIAAAFVEANVVEPLVEIALVSEEPGVIHRAAVALQRLLASATEQILGPKGGSVPEHAMLAMGALSSLASSCPIPPARQAAQDAIAFLGRERPELQPPPPQLVAEAVAKLKAEHEQRLREEEEEEAAAAAAEEAERAAEKDTSAHLQEQADKARAGTGQLPSVEEADSDDDLDVI